MPSERLNSGERGNCLEISSAFEGLRTLVRALARSAALQDHQRISLRDKTDKDGTDAPRRGLCSV
jgi:hypothetical protein